MGLQPTPSPGECVSETARCQLNFRELPLSSFLVFAQRFSLPYGIFERPEIGLACKLMSLLTIIAVAHFVLPSTPPLSTSAELAPPFPTSPLPLAPNTDSPATGFYTQSGIIAHIPQNHLSPCLLDLVASCRRL